MATGLWQDFKLICGVDWQTNTHRMKKNNHWKNNARFYNYGLFSELSWFATSQSRLITGARLDHNSVERYADNKQRSDNSPSGFIRFEHDVLDMPVLLYAGLGYSERFPDYWELFSYNARAGSNSLINQF